MNKIQTNNLSEKQIADAEKAAADAVKAADLGENVRVLAARRAHVGDIFTIVGITFVNLTNGNGEYRPASFRTSKGTQLPASAFAEFCDLGSGSPLEVATAAYKLKEAGTQFIIKDDSPTMMPARDITVGEGEDTRTVRQDAYMRHDWEIDLYEVPADNSEDSK